MSWDEDSDDSFTIKKPDPKGSSSKKKAVHVAKKREDPLFIKRDIAEGRAFNNSFTGPYPEETDHLHHDKGANPQFDFLRC
jgi:hypothetical protein